VYCTDYEGYEDSKDISRGGSVVFDIAEQGTYYFREDYGQGWVYPDFEPNSVWISPNDPHQEVTLINTYWPNVIEVTKEVDGYEGDKEFKITVEGVTEGEEGLEDNTSYKKQKSLKAGQSKSWLVPSGEFKITEVHPGNNWTVKLPENVTFFPLAEKSVDYNYYNYRYKEVAVINTYDDDNGGGSSNRRRHRNEPDEPIIVPEEPTPEAPVEIPEEPEVIIIPEEPAPEAPVVVIEEDPVPEALPKTGGFPLAAAVLGTALAGLGIMLRKRS